MWRIEYRTSDRYLNSYKSVNECVYRIEHKRTALNLGVFHDFTLIQTHDMGQEGNNPEGIISCR